MPRTFGDGLIHKSHFDAMVDGLANLPEHKPRPRSDVENKIGSLIADNLVENGATLQMGMFLSSHRHTYTCSYAGWMESKVEKRKKGGDMIMMYILYV